MRSLPPFIFSAILLFAAATHAPAQKKPLCPKPPPSPYKHNGEIVSTIDRAARRMRTTLEHRRPLAGTAGVFYFGATFLHADTRTGQTPTVDLVFYGTPPAATLNNGLMLVADGQPLALNERVSFRSQPASAGVLNESAKLTLTLSEVRKLTSARKVSVRAGSTELELTGNHLEALRELVSQMAPSPSRWSSAGDAASAR